MFLWLVDFLTYYFFVICFPICSEYLLQRAVALFAGHASNSDRL